MENMHRAKGVTLGAGLVAQYEGRLGRVHAVSQQRELASSSCSAM
jgi:hypothetical protein